MKGGATNINTFSNQPDILIMESRSAHGKNEFQKKETKKSDQYVKTSVLSAN